MPGYDSVGKFYFLSLLVNQLGPWIACVFRGNHEVHRANEALKQLRFAFCLTCQFFLQQRQIFCRYNRCLRVEDFFFSDRDKVLGSTFDRHCWAAACCTRHLSNWWPESQM